MMYRANNMPPVRRLISYPQQPNHPPTPSYIGATVETRGNAIFSGSIASEDGKLEIGGESIMLIVTCRWLSYQGARPPLDPALIIVIYDEY